MWQVNAHDVIHLGRTGEGRTFTGFVDGVIRAHAFVNGPTQDAVHTNLRTNLGDGGIDTKVDSASRADPFAWMTEKTAWQYKAVDFASLSEAELAAEVKKPYAAQLIAQGFAYRLCVCDDVPQERREEKERQLDGLVKAINLGAPAAKILLAGDLAIWASAYPGVVATFFNPQLRGKALPLRAWGANAVGSTRTYVSVPGWEEPSRRIASHVDFSAPVPSVIHGVQGESGVGKTRLVYETVASIVDAEGLIVYTPDEQFACEIASILATDAHSSAILVADECSVESRLRLDTLLRGYSDRVRVITIDNSGRSIATADPENVLARIPAEQLERILAENFPHVPPERRRMYGELSQGFVRLAADVCQRDAEIVAVGNVSPASDGIGAYVTGRLPDEFLSYVQAIALVERVGFSGDVAQELNDLCAFPGLDVARVRAAVNQLQNAPGFVAKAGRYLYVTPELVALILFHGAWQRWALDPDEFISTFPASLKQSFTNRVITSAREEVRAVVAGTFRRWFAGLRPNDLANVETVDNIVAAVESDPATFLPQLRGTICEASLDVLKAVKGDSQNGRWGPRRELVWMLERLAGFQDYFADAEACLRRLALAESEPKIGNNATSVWTSMFRIALSGSSVPFPDRLRLLESILASGGQESPLAAGALESVLSRDGFKMAGPSVVAGRIVPEEWRPRSDKEYRECLDMAVRATLESAARKDAGGASARKVVLKHVRFLLAIRQLGPLRDYFDALPPDEAELLKLTEGADHFLKYEGPRSEGSYVQEVAAWVKGLVPPSLHGRIVADVGVSPWHHSVQEQEAEWKARLRGLAVELLKDSEGLQEELPWLRSPVAASAGAFGNELGMVDRGGSLLDTVVADGGFGGSSLFARGYVAGLLTQPDQSGRVNALLDRLDAEMPAYSFEVFTVEPSKTDALARTLRLVDAGLLTPSHLFGAARFGSLSAEQLKAVLKRLNPEGGPKDPHHLSQALQLLSLAALHQGQEDRVDIGDVAEEGWDLLESVLATPGVRDTYWWDELLRALSPLDGKRAARAAVASMISEESGIRHDAKAAVQEIVKAFPSEFLQALGETLTDKKNAFRFYFGSHKELFGAIPDDELIRWLSSATPEIAVAVARHVPMPFVDAEGNAVVPRPTEYLLTAFEDNDRVFAEFSAGTHSLQMYSGDIASQHEQEAKVARRFLGHPLRRIREWAAIEDEQSMRQAADWRQRDEESRFR